MNARHETKPDGSHDEDCKYCAHSGAFEALKKGATAPASSEPAEGSLAAEVLALSALLREAAHLLGDEGNPAAEAEYLKALEGRPTLKLASGAPHMTEGARLIAEERLRQLEKEGWTPQHDDDHSSGELAWAAACYAAPERIYTHRRFAHSLSFSDPWPFDEKYDKRPYDGNVARPEKATREQRISLLVRAGGLIAAEIERLQRVGAKKS